MYTDRHTTPKRRHLDAVTHSGSIVMTHFMATPHDTQYHLNQTLASPTSLSTRFLSYAYKYHSQIMSIFLEFECLFLLPLYHRENTFELSTGCYLICTFYGDIDFRP